MSSHPKAPRPATAPADIRIAIAGTVGVPGRYGGFETLAENLVHHHAAVEDGTRLAVYCSGKANPQPRPDQFGSAALRYIGLDANGVQSIPYDILSMFDALRRGDNRILLLGVSGALCLPLIRLFSRARIVTNIDGIEWKRAKWRGLARVILRLSERFAVRFSHKVIADNQAIADYVAETYGRTAEVIAYGGDNALAVAPDFDAIPDFPETYALALCRIEPENNVHVILEGWESLDTPLVFVGNWDKSPYGQELKARYADHPNIKIVDPVYEPAALRAIRDRAWIYIHGHSAGGTNPSLVEMMQFAIPVAAWDCSFNRYSTDSQARYFKTAAELAAQVAQMDADTASQVGKAMKNIAQDRYLWERIAEDYFSLLRD